MNIYSNHAKKRIQQRGIPPLILNWLKEYGQISYDKKGCVIRYFDKKSKKILSKDVGNQIIKQLSNYMSCYAVFRNDLIVTVGYRYKKIIKH